MFGQTVTFLQPVGASLQPFFRNNLQQVNAGDAYPPAPSPRTVAPVTGNRGFPPSQEDDLLMHVPVKCPMCGSERVMQFRVTHLSADIELGQPIKPRPRGATSDTALASHLRSPHFEHRIRLVTSSRRLVSRSNRQFRQALHAAGMSAFTRQKDFILAEFV
jgi:hypothetical protein